ncbi:MAG: glycoside hydrolase family 127 protein, partial [Bacteroidales bacterium]|nr:glycoside hydrolase family 127 protein [Bacteroidales bacterium]
RYAVLKTGILLLTMICLIPCRGQVQIRSSEPEHSIPLPVASENLITCLNPGGYAGDLLAANERSWLQRVLTDNPNLFEAFANPEENTLFKVMWHGEFPGKILTGMAQTYRIFHDPKTLAAGNEMVRKFQSVQGTDGYLGPWSQRARFNGEISKWDTWGHYHCIFGLYQWYKVTGNRDALNVAIRAADCIYNHFIRGNQTFVSQKWAECNFAISHAFAILYQETGDEKYLQASEYIVQEEWKFPYDDYYTKKTLSCDWLSAAAEGKAFYQSNQVRWESLHTLMTLSTLFQITSDRTYYDAFEHFWQSIQQYDVLNFGGFGTGEGATGDKYGHGSETCCTVAWMAYTTEYLKISRFSFVADVLEMAWFNAALGSLLGYRDFVYINNSDGNRVPSRIDIGGHGFEGGRELNCCQANGNRGISQVAEWAVLTDNEKLYLNFYGPSKAETSSPGGTGIEIIQETEYPRNGKVRITLNMEKSESMRLNLRIPNWSLNTKIKINNKACRNIVPGNYYEINRLWETGDVIEIIFDMAVRIQAGEGRVKGKSSIYYGPVLLALQKATDFAGNITLKASSLKAMILKNDPFFWFYTEVETTEGLSVPLINYSSAGIKGEDYTSWLKVE